MTRRDFLVSGIAVGVTSAAPSSLGAKKITDSNNPLNLSMHPTLEYSNIMREMILSRN
ncbi:hypothetical protein GF407_17570 [candidate division KSB1 bacterium]|nr:hypothetical protein [candidate division KSB1 bacterium]